MAQSNELGRSQIVTRDGVVTALVLDTVSPDRISRMLFEGSAAAFYGRRTDDTALVSRPIKSVLIFPFSEL
jgi:hypothetical protein